jgi:hypothetical protein
MVDMIDMLSMVDKGDGNLICKLEELSDFTPKPP